MPKCCMYEKGTERIYVCTTDPDCPDLKGWTLIGSWGVDDCKNCRDTGKPDKRDYSPFAGIEEVPVSSIELDDDDDEVYMKVIYRCKIIEFLKWIIKMEMAIASGKIPGFDPKLYEKMRLEMGLK